LESLGWVWLGSSSASNIARRALASLFAGAAAAWLLAGTASAAPAFSLGRATSAPVVVAGLTEYAMQLDDTTDTGGDQGVEGPATEIPPMPGGSPGQGSMKNPTEAAIDSIARADSLSRFPQNFPAPLETIAPPPAYFPSPSASGGTTPSVPGKRRLFGLSTIVLIAGLIALHFLVVSMVSE